MPRKEKDYTATDVEHLYVDAQGYYHGMRKVKLPPRPDGKKLKYPWRNVWQALDTKKKPTAIKALRAWLTRTDACPIRQEELTFSAALVRTAEKMQEEEDAKKGRATTPISTHLQGLVNAIRRACTWNGGADIPFSKLTVEHIEAIFEKRKPGKGMFCFDPNKQVITSRRVGGEQYNKCFNFVDRACRIHVKGGYRAGGDNPFDMAGIVRMPMPKVKRYTPSPEEAAAIVDYVLNNKLNQHAKVSALALEATYKTGLGTAELMGLTRGKLNYGMGIFEVVRKKTLVPFDVPFFSWTHDIINRMMTGMVERNGGAVPDDDTRVFSIKSPRKALESACKALGFHPYSMRGLRRTFIYVCRWGGVPKELVAELQGQSDGGKLIDEVYDDAECPSDEQRKRDWVKQMHSATEGAAEIFGGLKTSLIHPDEILPESDVAREIARRLAAAKEALDRRCVEAQKKNIVNTWSKAAKRLGLPFDPKRPLNEQHPTLIATMTGRARAANMLKAADRLDGLDLNELDAQETAAKQKRGKSRKEITQRLPSAYDEAFTKETRAELQRRLQELQVEADEADAEVHRIAYFKATLKKHRQIDAENR